MAAVTRAWRYELNTLFLFTTSGGDNGSAICTVHVVSARC